MSGSGWAGRLGVVTGTNPPAALLAGDGRRATVAVDDHAVQVIDAGTFVVLDRHGLDAHVPAHRIDHVRNAEALAACGCDRVVAVGSTGALRADWPVGTVVAPDDFFAPWVTVSRYDDARGHTVPGFDQEWRAEVLAAWRMACSAGIVDGGVYAQTVGPRFETPAEVRFLAGQADLVGMTLAAECIVAREVGLAYAAVCVVDNLANGLDGESLSTERFVEGVETNRDAVAHDVVSLIAALVGEGR